MPVLELMQQLGLARDLSRDFASSVTDLRRTIVEIGELTERNHQAQREAFLQHMDATAALVNATSDVEERIRSLQIVGIPALKQLLGLIGLGPVYWQMAPYMARAALTGELRYLSLNHVLM